MSGKTMNGVPVEDIIKSIPMPQELVERIAHRKVKRPDIAIVESDPEWPNYFEAFKSRILAALETDDKTDGTSKVSVISIEHVGSTSVPTLPAKAVIDIDLVLSDNSRSAEPFYVPRLEAAGFQYLLREPAWHEHRFFAAHEPMSCNLHVFGPKCPEVERHRIFRDWLKEHDDDLELYAKTKRDAATASREKGEDMYGYSARKEDVIEEIRNRAFKELGYL